jgi:hypothetical protein
MAKKKYRRYSPEFKRHALKWASETMRQIGKDMSSHYKEILQGGLYFGSNFGAN